jgi:C-terminal processing protease CtpA/Prc
MTEVQMKFDNKNSIPSKEKENRFTGNLYVLTSHDTFSAATTFSGTIKDNRLGCIVGEETYDGPSSYSCIMIFELPNTKINIQNSTLHKVRAAGYDDGRGVIPDFIVNTTYSDYLNGNDKIMNYTYWLIKNGIKN